LCYWHFLVQVAPIRPSDRLCCSYLRKAKSPPNRLDKHVAKTTNWLPFVYTCRNNRSFEQRCKRSVLDLDRAARDISRGGREEIERSKEGLLTESGLTVRKTASRDEITTRARHKIRHATVELNTVPEWRSERASSAINGRFRRCHAANGRDRASTYVGRSRATIARTRWCPMCEYNMIPRPEKCPRKRGVRDNARKDKVRDPTVYARTKSILKDGLAIFKVNNWPR